jgi:biopolymer transport protein ExbB
VFALLKAGGWPMWPLLLASVIAVALIIERSISLRRSRVVPSGLLERIISDVGRSGAPPEMINRVAAHSPLGQVLAAGLRDFNSSREVMKESIEESGRAVAHELERFMTTLGTIAAISPLLGLFGTIVGMIDIFASQGASGADPTQLARGISIALYTTGFGLIIAIPATIFWRHFRRLIDDFVVDMEQQAIKLVEVAHGERVHGERAHHVERIHGERKR